MKIHFIGIGGIGMSALARYFKAQKYSVSGSDLARSDISDALKKDGIQIAIGHRKQNIHWDMDVVVYNRAIPANNPELVEAGKMKLYTLPYAEVLGELTKAYATIAITGSHGKSTTTALTSLVFMKAGLDPTILIGTKMKELGDKNLRIGKSNFMVLEADDYGAAITHYFPTIAVITNIDKEHLDFYGSFGNLKKAFLQFLVNTAEGGAFILNRDDAALFSLKTSITALAKKKKIKLVWYSSHDASTRRIKTILKIPGHHNLSNALAAYAVGKLLRIPEKKILGALHLYNGAWRRMEYRGEWKIDRNTRALIYDDYAHHPTEIKASLEGFREKFPKAKLICVFQPHQAKRIASLFKDFQLAFQTADATIVLPLYKVAGRDEMKFKGRDSEALVSTIQGRFPNVGVRYLNDIKGLKKTLRPLIPHSKSSVIVMMGAGDIVNYTDVLLH